MRLLSKYALIAVLHKHLPALVWPSLVAKREFALDQEGELALIQWILVGVTILWLPIVW